MQVRGYAYSLSQENLYYHTIKIVTKVHLQVLHVHVVAVMQRFQYQLVSYSVTVYGIAQSSYLLQYQQFSILLEPRRVDFEIFVSGCFYNILSLLASQKFLYFDYLHVDLTHVACFVTLRISPRV